MNLKKYADIEEAMMRSRLHINGKSTARLKIINTQSSFVIKTTSMIRNETGSCSCSYAIMIMPREHNAKILLHTDY